MTIRYVAGGTLPASSPTYVAREADAVLCDRLLAGEYSHVLTARQIGKSSLMVKTTARLRELGVTCAIVDLSTIGYHVEPEQWYHGLIWALAGRLNAEDRVSAFLKSAESISPAARWVHAVRKLVLDNISGPLVIFFDEIDITRRLPFSNEFLASIRACYNARSEDPDLQRVTFCLIGAAAAADLISDPLLTPFNVGARIELNDFTKNEADILRAGLDASADRSRRIFDRVFYWTNGHPYLTQRLCKEIVDCGNVRSSADVDACCRRLFLTTDASVREDNLATVAHRATPDDPETRTRLLSRYAQALAGKRVTDDETDAATRQLKLSGIVAERNGALTVRNRIYATVFDTDWIRRNMPGDELRRQRKAYRLGVRRAAALSATALCAFGALTAVAVDQALTARSAGRLAEHRAKYAAKERDRANTAAAMAAQQRDRADESAKEARRMALVAAKREGEARLSAQNAAIERAAAIAASKARQLALAAALEGTRRAALFARRSETAARSASHYLYIADMKLVQEAWENNDFSQVRSLLRSTAGNPDRGFEWGYWGRMLHLERLCLRGHKDRLTSVCFSGDGARLATGCDDRTVRIWDARTGRTVRVLGPLGSWVSAVAFSPDGETIVAGCGDGVLRAWNASSGRLTLQIQRQPAPITSVDISPDGRMLVTGCDDHMARLWDASTGKLLRLFYGHRDEIASVAFDLDGLLVATGSKDCTARIWETGTGRRIITLHTGGSEVMSVAFSPDATRLAAGCQDGMARIWDFRARQLTDFRAHDGWVRSIAYSRDGERLLTGSTDNTAQVWDARSGRRLYALPGHTGQVRAAVFSPDGRTVATASWDGTARLWDAGAPSDVRSFGHAERPVAAGALSPDGRRVAGCSSEAGAWIRDVETAGPVCRLPGPGSETPCLAFSPRGDRLLAGGPNVAACIWNLAPVRLSVEIKRHGGVKTAAFSPDGRRIATTGVDRDIDVYAADSGKLLIAMRGHRKDVTSIAWRNDGLCLVSASRDGTCVIWDASTGKPVRRFGDRRSHYADASFSPDGARVAAAISDMPAAAVWDARTGRQLMTLRAFGAGLRSVGFSPDGRRIATCGYERFVRMWESATGRQVLTLPLPGGQGCRAGFSQDGKSLFAAGADGIQVWSADCRTAP